MFPNSGCRLSEKIMLKKTNQSEMPDQLKVILLWCVSAIAGASEMATQQRDIAAIGAEEDVEGVAGERHRANEPFQRDIGRHPREQESRHGGMPRRADNRTAVRQWRRRCRERGAA